MLAAEYRWLSYRDQSGALKQVPSSSKMLHGIGEQISCLSRHLTSHPAT